MSSKESFRNECGRPQRQSRMVVVSHTRYCNNDHHTLRVGLVQAQQNRSFNVSVFDTTPLTHSLYSSKARSRAISTGSSIHESTIKVTTISS